MLDSVKYSQLDNTHPGVLVYPGGDGWRTLFHNGSRETGVSMPPPLNGTVVRTRYHGYPTLSSRHGTSA